MNKYKPSDTSGASGDLDPMGLWSKIVGEAAKPLSISQQALRNDRRIEKIAEYQITNGYINMPQRPTSHSLPSPAQEFDLFDLEGQGSAMSMESYVDKLGKVFSEFKGFVMRGTFTLDQLEDRVYAQYGIVSDVARRKAGIIPKDEQLTEEMNNILKEEVK